MEQMLFKLNVFEGPLELMLHLISKHKLNINDIEISLLLDQYLAFIEDMKAADLEVASEFLAMAARLVYIKTVALLPVHEEGDALKRELEGQLLEYQLCKLIATRMAQMYRGGVIFTREAAVLPQDKIYRREHLPDELQAAYITAAGKGKRRLPPPRTAFTGIVSRRMVSVESRIVFVLKKLYTVGEVAYNEFFYSDDRSELVATFLAMLELIKSKRVRISEDNSRVVFNQSIPFEEKQLEEIAEEISSGFGDSSDQNEQIGGRSEV